MPVLFTRARCHLCDDAKALLERAGVSFAERDVSGSVELEGLYGWDVPVLVSDGGEVLLKGVFAAHDVARVARALRGA